MRLCRCVVPVRGSPHDDDRRLDAHVVDLGMSPQQVLDEQPVREQLDEQSVVADHARPAEPGLGAERRAEHVERLAEAVVAEVGQARLGDGLRP